MESRRLAVVPLLLVLATIGATMDTRTMSGTRPVSDYNNDEVQFLGKFVLEQYNKKGESHLLFIQVVNGTVFSLPLSNQKIWNLVVEAKNCSDVSGTPPATYSAQVFENLFGGQIRAYGSNFTTPGIIYKL